MRQDARTASQAAPFPPIPPRLAEAHDARGLRLRRFGQSAGDLDIDLSRDVADPRAVTEVLCRCTVQPDGGPVDPQLFWELSVGKRLECLLVLAGLESAGRFEVALTCPRESCRQPIEVDLSLDELLEIGGDADEEPVVVEWNEQAPGNGRRAAAFRRPRGADQLAWLQWSCADEHSAKVEIIRSLAAGSPGDSDTDSPAFPADPPAAWVEGVEARLGREDPLVQFTLDVGCPFCGSTLPHEIDLAALALGRLLAAQSRLVEAIHRLATHYHWSGRTCWRCPRGGARGTCPWSSGRRHAGGILFTTDSRDGDAGRRDHGSHGAGHAPASRPPA